MTRAYYSDYLFNFLKDSSDEIYGKISGAYDLSTLEIQQSNAWKRQIQILKQNLDELEGKLYFEFNIPRMGKRVDNILIIKNCIFIIEFKIGSSSYDNYAKEQVLGYALDMNNFHEGSHNQIIIPILVAENATRHNTIINRRFENLYDTISTNANCLRVKIEECLLHFTNQEIIDIEKWEKSVYKPTPTIIEAATALYRNHNVNEISRSDAGAENLSKTSECISSIIDYSKNNRKKSICFVTGVPGAGKTLAGLNIANLRSDYEKEEHTVFLSGNMPLVAVLQEALTLDKVNLLKELGKHENKKIISSEVKSFIQLIHHFRDASLKDSENPPIEKVTIFDEAQRAWTQKKTSDFMKQKKGYHDFDKSEPEFLIEVMDRHKDWCTIICLIGGGQEINTGEAGLEEWIRPFSDRFEDWDIYYSPKITEDDNYIKQKTVLNILNNRQSVSKPELHLSVSLRSFRSAQLSEFINHIIKCNTKEAQELYKNHIKNSYPIKLTRNLEMAKKWLKQFEFGSNRTGLIASSGAKRLRPVGINVKDKVDAPKWFLHPKDDVRSSFFLEEVATEFDIQGLELDYTCIAWDGNLYFDNTQWRCQKFTGSSWKRINNLEDWNYLLNSYRVLLTRARQGMVIYIPYGSNEDHTRPHHLYDGTYNYLKQLGIEEL